MAKLAEYRAKRDFAKTSEPAGAVAHGRGTSFVIQKHDASRLHYDFRLELDGVLKSWAVARGPSLVAGEKRLAVEVEDHPLAYGEFEGTIPEGEYGGGTVLLWDRGRWVPDGDPAKGYAEGQLVFRLEGGKLQGAWRLVRMRRRAGEEKDSWLLIKSKDEHARTKDDPDILEEQPLSVKTGRSLEEIGGKPPRSQRSKATGSRKRASKEAATSASPAKTSKARAKKAKGEDNEVLLSGVRLTHPDRVLWPDQGITKRELADYYLAASEHLLPHLVDRPLTLVRCPGGTEGTCFFQKHSWAGLDEHVARRQVSDGAEEQEVLFVRDIQGVLGLVQAGVLEIHPWGATLADLDRPDRMIFDFDPSEDVPWPAVLDAAREVRDRLKGHGLESFAKTTGGKGLHVVVPLVPKAGWDEVKAFARGMAEAMEQDAPERYLTKATKAERTGRIFIDYLRNAREATAVAAFSTRARSGAPVSTPLAWSELSPAIRSNGFTVENVPERLGSLKENPWAGFKEIRQELPKLDAARSRKGRR